MRQLLDYLFSFFQAIGAQANSSIPIKIAS